MPITAEERLAVMRNRAMVLAGMVTAVPIMVTADMDTADMVMVPWRGRSAIRRFAI